MSVQNKRESKVCLLFIGPPGCGKGTHSSHIATSHSIPRLEMGEYFRQLEKTTRDEEILKKLEPMLKGDLVDDNFTIWRAKTWLIKHTSHKIIIVDGAIRTRAQLRELYPFIEQRGYKVKVVWFKTSLKACYERLLSKPRAGRNDDLSRRNILHRFVVYARETRHLKEAISMNGVGILPIDNTALSIDEVRPLITGFFRQEAFPLLVA